MTQHQNFLNSLIQRIRMGRSNKKVSSPESIITLCNQLVSKNGEATLFSLAKIILEDFNTLSEEQKKSFFLQFLDQFGVDRPTLKKALIELNIDDEGQLRKLHQLIEPKSHELLRRLNQVPNGTSVLLKMRESLLECIKAFPELKSLDSDFVHLFKSWFNRGFLRLERIDWSTSARVLEKIMQYEAVHDISDWEDLQNRVAADDRRLYAFFHPALPDEPLIFIEVALMDDTPNSIMPILDTSVKPIDPFSATTAVFYSISNCQMGLKSVSFGSFLIKQVVTEIEKEFKQIKHFVTLSPVPGLKKWSNKINLLEDKDLPENIINDISECCKDNKPNPLVLNRLTYYYLTQIKRKNGQAINPVAHFHLGNGASLYKIHTDANVNQSALDDSWGVMVNYLYDLESVAKNHEDYANQESVAVSPKLTKSIQNNKKKILAY
ncbi:malonyl-CoA decarboxylase [Candidatus Thioglobus sp.]|nr:malonyl-CoA decarboxylase [Candidatus Thioglobus sp.]MDB4037626.1 malonyl-CoA decarboxylase [Candidatus Thioglobus sp.]